MAFKNEIPSCTFTTIHIESWLIGEEWLTDEQGAGQTIIADSALASSLQRNNKHLFSNTLRFSRHRIFNSSQKKFMPGNFFLIYLHLALSTCRGDPRLPLFPAGRTRSAAKASRPEREEDLAIKRRELILEGLWPSSILPQTPQKSTRSRQ